MSRESCITHRSKQAMAIVRQDYYELMNHDACAAALLNIFEYWANGAMAADITTERPWVGARPIREFEQMLLGIATDKQIRKRLALLESRGFIRTKAPAQRGSAKTYQVLVPEIQQELIGQITELEMDLRSNDQCSFGQITDEDGLLRSNDRRPFGQITEGPSVKQPTRLRSNDRALKKKTKEFKKEDLKEARLSLINSQQDIFESPGVKIADAEQRKPLSSDQAGVVQYSQPPETIDLADLWATNPSMAKAQLRFIAPEHRRLKMVAHGFGQWWIGPGLNDFDELLIRACQQRKRKLQQPDSIGDAKTFINNLIRTGDWANFSLRCDEAEGLRDRASVAQVSRHQSNYQVSIGAPASTNTLRRTKAEQRQSAIGLARFKVSHREIERAKEIADQLMIPYSQVGITADSTALVAV